MAQLREGSVIKKSTGNEEIATKDYIDNKVKTNVPANVKFTDYIPVNKAGDTMTGVLTLSENPTSTLHAATKKYVDDNSGSKVYVQTTKPPGRKGDVWIKV